MPEATVEQTKQELRAAFDGQYGHLEGQGLEQIRLHPLAGNSDGSVLRSLSQPARRAVPQSGHPPDRGGLSGFDHSAPGEINQYAAFAHQRQSVAIDQSACTVNEGYVHRHRIRFLEQVVESFHLFDSGKSQT